VTTVTDDLTTKPCRCGGVKKQLLNFISPEGTDLSVPVRAGWYCESCGEFEKAILRERVVAGMTEKDLEKRDGKEDQ